MFPLKRNELIEQKEEKKDGWIKVLVIVVLSNLIEPEEYKERGRNNGYIKITPDEDTRLECRNIGL